MLTCIPTPVGQHRRLRKRLQSASAEVRVNPRRGGGRGPVTAGRQPGLGGGSILRYSAETRLTLGLYKILVGGWVSHLLFPPLGVSPCGRVGAGPPSGSLTRVRIAFMGSHAAPYGGSAPGDSG